MKNQDLKSGLFGSIGENMVAFELAKRNWYVYRPYFDNRIDFIAQKFVCKKCFHDWESKHIIHCSNKKCPNHNKSLNVNNLTKTRKCINCNYVFNKYAVSLDCPNCSKPMEVTKSLSSNQRNYKYECNNCETVFTSQTRNCVKCGSKESIEYPVCKKCNSEIVPKSEKCDNPNCNSSEYALIVRTIQVKSSHEESKETIGFNFKMQDLIDDDRHFLIVYLRAFENNEEKHKFWVMTVEEFKKEYVNDNASTRIYQNNRLHPPSDNSRYYFDEQKYNKLRFDLQKAVKSNDSKKIKQLKSKLKNVDIFGKLDKKIKGDF